MRRQRLLDKIKRFRFITGDSLLARKMSSLPLSTPLLSYSQKKYGKTDEKYKYKIQTREEKNTPANEHRGGCPYRWGVEHPRERLPHAL